MKKLEIVLIVVGMLITSSTYATRVTFQNKTGYDVQLGLNVTHKNACGTAIVNDDLYPLFDIATIPSNGSYTIANVEDVVRSHLVQQFPNFTVSKSSIYRTYSCLDKNNHKLQGKEEYRFTASNYLATYTTGKTQSAPVTSSGMGNKATCMVVVKGVSAENQPCQQKNKPEYKTLNQTGTISGSFTNGQTVVLILLLNWIINKQKYP